MAIIKCPQCGMENYFKLAQSAYQGPFRCMKCRETFTIRIENDDLKSCELLDKQETDKLNIRNKHYG
ncbi:MAG: hypothetical protein HYX83_01865 [Chloroflexi bacterium]|nr:hypothetical protein [Chloroflexota bacterium]